MASTKISAGADPVTLLATDKVPLARAASATAYAATIAELATFTNTAYAPPYATATPTMNSTGAPGTASTVSRGDHQHPSDTSRLATAGGTLTGPVTGTTATFAVFMSGTAGPTWTSGAGAPSATEPVGSLYSRTGGAVGSTLYVSRGGGTWNAVAGV